MELPHNDLSSIKLTSSDIERQIFNYDFESTKIRDNFIEWNVSLPMFATAFYQCVFKNNRIPKQIDFWNHYLDINKSNNNLSNLSEYQLSALKSRAFRAYPSLIRDIHFVLKIQESNCFDNVIYNIDLDLIHGVDILIIHNGNSFAVNLYTMTPNSIDARKIKKNRHLDDNNYINIEMPLNFQNCRKCGNFFIYGNIQLAELKNIITKYK